MHRRESSLLCFLFGREKIDEMWRENEEFTERLPCIITTNDLEMVKIFRDDKLFNTQVFIIEITKYMGAPGTERLDLMKNEFILSDETVFELNKLDTKKVYSDNLNL